MKIDAHLHVWERDRGDYRWLTPAMGPLWKDVGKAEHESWLTACGIEGVILVQAADSVAETHYLLGLAADWHRVVGVVGWIPMDSPSAPEILSELAHDRYLVGIRPMLQDLEDDAWCLGDHLTPAYQALEQCSLTFDLLIKPRHLRTAITLRSRYPEIRMVIDHAAKPFIPARKPWRDFTDWTSAMKTLAALPNTWCKWSGLMTEAEVGGNADDYKPYADALLDTFGPTRLIWGSDAPVCELAGGPLQWDDLSRILLHSLSEHETRQVRGLNAEAAYNLPPARVRT